MDNNNMYQYDRRDGSFIEGLRLGAVILTTIWLILLLITTADKSCFLFTTVFVISMFFFFITVPVAILWIYSLIMVIFRRNKTDKKYLWVHIGDLVLLGISFYIINLPSHKCDAFIMAQHYEEHSDKMHDVVNRYREMLPDSTRLNIEFGKDKSDVFSKQVMKELERAVTDSCGCIGIYISGYPDEEYSILEFRRINMGMFKYHLYDKALSQAQIDSLNARPELIVYNDSTVFCYGSGAFGEDIFPVSQEFLKELRNKNH